MKKRIFSVLLVVAMLASMVVLPAYAADTVQNGNLIPENCPCGCGLLSAVTWTEISGNLSATTLIGTNEAISTGTYHFKLTGNTRRGAGRIFATTSTSTAKIVVDLNGKNLYNDSGNYVPINLQGDADFYLLDTSSTGTGAVYSKTATGVAYSAVNLAGTSTLNIYGGTIKSFGQTATVACGTVLVGSTATLNMYGGKIQATTVADTVEKPCGGAIRMSAGEPEVNLYDGVIETNAANDTIRIYANSADRAPTFTAGDVSIAGNIAVIGTNATITIKDEPTIANLDLSDGAVVNASGLTGGTVKVTAAQDTAFTTSFGTKAVAEAKASYFADANTESGLVPTATDAGTLMLSVAATPDPGPGPDPDLATETFYCPHCEDETTFVEWTRTADNDVAVTAGHYYLKDAVTINTVEISGTVVVNLNGSNITRDDELAFDVLENATFVLFDSTANKATVSGSTQVVRVGTNATFKAYDCKLTNNRTEDTTDLMVSVVGCPSETSGKEVYLEDCVITASTAKVRRGAALRTMSTPVTLKNCTVNGGKVSDNGAAIYVNDGTLTIDGGSVFNGTADTAGNGIWINGAGTVNVKGGATVGDINVGNTGAKINLDGKVTIAHANLIASDTATINAKITVTNPDAASSIGVTAIANANILADNSLEYANAVTVAKAFNSVDTNYKVALRNNMLQLTASPLYALVDGDTSVYFMNRTPFDNVYNGIYNTSDKIQSGAYLKILNVENLTIRYPVVIDVNGQSFKLTMDTDGTTSDIYEGCDVYLFDSANADYATFGSVTINAEATVNGGKVSYAAPDGKTYYAVNNQGVYSFHRLEMSLTQVVLRTAVESGGGMYYYATYNCDDTLKAAVKSFGIKYELYDADGVTKIGDNTLRSNVDGSSFAVGKALAVGHMFGILEDMKAIYEPADTGMMKISGTPYVEINGEDVDGTAVKKSLFDLCKQVDGLITAGTNAAEYTEYLNTLLNVTWATYDLTAWNTELVNVKVNRGA